MVQIIGSRPADLAGNATAPDSYIPGARHRSLAKAVSWRIVGSLDTLVLSFLILTLLGPLLGLEPAGHAQHAVTASHIALTELITKVVLYYAHERGWARVRWGAARG